MPDVPKRCPQCHSPVAERFPHAVMYDCGFSLFNDGQPVTDDYPAECQRRRIKRLENQLAATRAEAERWRKRYEALRAGGGGAVVVLTHDDCNTLMHGLRSREELEGDLLPEALERYQQLVDRIIDVGVGWSGGAEDA